MHRRAFVASLISPLTLSLGCAARVRGASNEAPVAPSPAPADSRARALEAMRRATTFMREKVAHRGGYVWAYLPDFSRSWGELEAKRSMCWLQPPGTPSVGHLFLDAFHATRDRFYLEAALEVAGAVVAAQHASGGWNYVHDFAGEASLRDWYQTVARNGWRLEEFHQHPDNGTFDDACTAAATQFLMRLQASHRTAEVGLALERAIRFLLESQYPSGGWPQRYPLENDYTRLLTFNDDVLGENIRSLLMIRATLRDFDVLGQLRSAMDSVATLQRPAPQPAWGLQHDLAGKPAAARSFEPAALATHTTGANIKQLLAFHRLTGDPKYLARVPEALDWLDKVRLSPEQSIQHGGTHPTFIEIGSGDRLYVHRRGSNVVNGKYFVDEKMWPRLSHYAPVRSIDVPALRRAYADARAPGSGARLLDLPPARALPKYFSFGTATLAELCTGQDPPSPVVTDARVRELVEALDGAGRWLSPLELSTNPYRGPGDPTPYEQATYASTNVGDRTDTSPYRQGDRPSTYPPETPPLGISVRTFLRNMAELIAYVSPIR